MPHDPYSGCYYQAPGGLPGYDEWKLTNPYDGPFEEPDEEEECDHEEYDVDLAGRAECDRCPHTWWLSSAELERYHRRQAEAAKAWDRERRRERSLFWRAWRWIKAQRLSRRAQFAAKLNVNIDDDIPF